MIMAVRGRASPVNWLPNWEMVSDVQSLRKLGFRQSVSFWAVVVSMRAKIEFRFLSVAHFEWSHSTVTCSNERYESVEKIGFIR